MKTNPKDTSNAACARISLALNRSSFDREADKDTRKFVSLASSDPQAAQRHALAFVQSLTHATKAPTKPFVHVACHRVGAIAFVCETLEAARDALKQFATAGYTINFAVFMSGRELVPLVVKSTAEAA